MPGAEFIAKLLSWLSQLALWGSLASILVGAVLAGLAPTIVKLHQARPRARGALPRPDSFFVPASADPAEDPERVAIRILRVHTRFPAAGPDVAAAEIRAVSTVADGGRLADNDRGELQRLRDGYPGGTTRFWVGPLGVRSADDGPDRVRVDVWFSQVVAAPRLPLYQEWRVAKVTLAREGGVWRLADYNDMPGLGVGDGRAQADPAAEGVPEHEVPLRPEAGDGVVHRLDEGREADPFRGPPIRRTRAG